MPDMSDAVAFGHDFKSAATITEADPIVAVKLKFKAAKVAAHAARVAYRSARSACLSEVVSKFVSDSSAFMVTIPSNLTFSGYPATIDEDSELEQATTKVVATVTYSDGVIVGMNLAGDEMFRDATTPNTVGEVRKSIADATGLVVHAVELQDNGQPMHDDTEFMDSFGAFFVIFHPWIDWQARFRQEQDRRRDAAMGLREKYSELLGELDELVAELDKVKREQRKARNAERIERSKCWMQQRKLEFDAFCRMTGFRSRRRLPASLPRKDDIERQRGLKRLKLAQRVSNMAAREKRLSALRCLPQGMQCKVSRCRARSGRDCNLEVRITDDLMDYG